MEAMEKFDFSKVDTASRIALGEIFEEGRVFFSSGLQVKGSFIIFHLSLRFVTGRSSAWGR